MFGFPVEEIFVEDWIVVGECLRQPGQPRGRDLLQGLHTHTLILLLSADIVFNFTAPKNGLIPAPNDPAPALEHFEKCSCCSNKLNKLSDPIFRGDLV